MAYGSGARPPTQIDFNNVHLQFSRPRQRKKLDALREEVPKKPDVAKSLTSARTQSPGQGPSTQLPKVRELSRASDLRDKLLDARSGSPWEHYDECYELQLNTPVTVALQKSAPSKLVSIRKFSKPTYEKDLYTFQQVQHESFVAALEAFTTGEYLYIVLEHMPIALDHIVKSPPYPSETQLVALLAPILAGLTYLESEGLAHGSLSCENVLLSTEGDVKIANQECCHRSGRNTPADLRALGSITMLLMQKYAKDGGAIGVDDLRRWPSDSDAVGFLSETTTAASAQKLMEHPLVCRTWRKQDLKGMISLGQIASRRFYKCSVR